MMHQKAVHLSGSRWTKGRGFGLNIWKTVGGEASQRLSWIRITGKQWITMVCLLCIHTNHLRAYFNKLTLTSVVYCSIWLLLPGVTSHNIIATINQTGQQSLINIHAAKTVFVCIQNGWLFWRHRKQGDQDGQAATLFTSCADVGGLLAFYRGAPAVLLLLACFGCSSTAATASERLGTARPFEGHMFRLTVTVLKA